MSQTNKTQTPDCWDSIQYMHKGWSVRTSYAMWRSDVLLGIRLWYDLIISMHTAKLWHMSKGMVWFHTNTDAELTLMHMSVLKFPSPLFILKPSMLCTRESKPDLLCTHGNGQEKGMIFWACQNDASWVLWDNPQKVKLSVRDSVVGEPGPRWRDTTPKLWRSPQF